MEARLHQHQFEQLVPNDGIRFPAQTEQRATILDAREWTWRSAAARALGSTLDCLAAVAIGVLRMPFSIQRAAFADLTKTIPAKLRLRSPSSCTDRSPAKAVAGPPRRHG